MYVLNNVFDWYLLTSLASVVSDDRMTFSTLLHSTFEILWNCSEIFLEFLENLVCDFLNFINKYIIVRNTISPLQQSTQI